MPRRDLEWTESDFRYTGKPDLLSGEMAKLRDEIRTGEEVRLPKEVLPFIWRQIIYTDLSFYGFQKAYIARNGQEIWQRKTEMVQKQGKRKKQPFEQTRLL